MNQEQKSLLEKELVLMQKKYLDAYDKRLNKLTKQRIKTSQSEVEAILQKLYDDFLKNLNYSNNGADNLGSTLKQIFNQF